MIIIQMTLVGMKVKRCDAIIPVAFAARWEVFGDVEAKLLSHLSRFARGTVTSALDRMFMLMRVLRYSDDWPCAVSRVEPENFVVTSWKARRIRF